MKVLTQRKWNRIAESGGMGRLKGRTYGGTCYLIAWINGDTLVRVDTYSDKNLSVGVRGCVPVIVKEWKAASFSEALDHARREICRTQSWKWAKPWIQSGMKAHMARLDLYRRAKAGEIKAPAELVEKAVIAKKKHDEIMHAFMHTIMS